MRHAVRILVLGAIATTTIAGGRAQPDAAALLTRARQALGGEAAFKALSTLEVFGSVVQTAKAGTVMSIDGSPVVSAVGDRVNLSLDLKVALPDRFVRTNRYEPPGSGGGQYVVEYRGFNGSDLIRDTNSPSGGLNDSKLAPSPKLPATRLKYLLDAKHSFAALLLPLLAASYDGYPFDFGVGEERQLPGGPATAVTVAGADGLQWKLYLDNATHLPVLLTGRMKPMISGLLVEYALQEEDWRMTIADYRVSSGFKWPHKLTSTFGDDVSEEIHYDRFLINPKIDPKVFTPNDGR